MKISNVYFVTAQSICCRNKTDNNNDNIKIVITIRGHHRRMNHSGRNNYKNLLTSRGGGRNSRATIYAPLQPHNKSENKVEKK